MAADVETMFYTREKPWHGLGVKVEEALSSGEALKTAGLDWKVVQQEIRTKEGLDIPGCRANVRDTDQKVLGIVSERYRVVQNQEAFAFTDRLLGEGVRYETAGSLNGGRKVWVLARMPREYIMLGDRISPYLVFSNTHDGSGAIRVAMTPLRVVCSNTLNLALSTAARSWSAIHTAGVQNRIGEAEHTLFLAECYMDMLGKEFEKLSRIKMTDAKVKEALHALLPLEETMSRMQKKNVQRQREDLKMRYFDAPDLQEVPKNAYRFLNAVSDFATHGKPLRDSGNYKENLFSRVMDGNTLTDQAYRLVKHIA